MKHGGRSSPEAEEFSAWPKLKGRKEHCPGRAAPESWPGFELRQAVSREEVWEDFGRLKESRSAASLTGCTGPVGQDTYFL